MALTYGCIYVEEGLDNGRERASYAVSSRHMECLTLYRPDLWSYNYEADTQHSRD
jgi:hypothetical protein